MEKIQNSQIIKLAALSAILVGVVGFKGPIQQVITHVRTKVCSQDPNDKIGAGRGKDLLSALKSSQELMTRLKQSSKATEDESLSEDEAENPDRDIFRFTERALSGMDLKTKETNEVKEAGDIVKVQAKERPVLTLEATLTGDKPMAVINNQPLGLGEEISGYKIEHIDNGRVVLKAGDDEIILRLKQEIK